MISWIQRSFQRHFKVVFGLLLGITILSFVITIGAGPGIGRGESRSASREFFGHDLAAADGMGRIMEDATISIEFQLGGLGGVNDDQLKNYALQRVAAIHMADQYHIPGPSPDEMTLFIKSLRIFAGENGQFDPARYNAFRASLSGTTRASETDAVRVIADDIRIRELQSLLDGPGYVLPNDVKDAMIREDTEWTIAVATVDYASFNPKIDPTDEDLQKFFKDNSFRYKLDPKVVAGAVSFSALDHIASVKVTDAEVRAYYDQNPSRFPKPTPPASPDGKDAKTDAKPEVKVGGKPGADADFAAVRSQVEGALKLERAQHQAVKAASDIAFELYQDKVTAGGVDAWLASHKLRLDPLAPFTQKEGPAEFHGSPEIAEAAFRLSAEHYFSDAMATPTGAVIVIWKALQPARDSQYSEVQARVKADFLEDQKRRRFIALGKDIGSQIAARAKAGEAFDKAVAAVAAANAVKIEAKSPPMFTLRAPPADLSETVMSSLERLDKGGISDMDLAADKGYIVYAIDKKAPDTSEKNPKFSETRAQIAGFSSRGGATSILSQIVEQELKRTEPSVK